MRVISGSKRGVRLGSPKGLSTRPTTDRIKESLFNILSPALYGCSFLDLFAGSGSIGIEALSRGAREAVFVDKNRQALGVIKENIEKTNFSDKATVLGMDCFAAVKLLKEKGMKFDIIFMDPPYYSTFIQNILDETDFLDILNNEGIVVVEQAKDEAELDSEGLEVFRIKDYGRTTKMTFLKGVEEQKC